MYGMRSAEAELDAIWVLAPTNAFMPPLLANKQVFRNVPKHTHAPTVAQAIQWRLDVVPVKEHDIFNYDMCPFNIWRKKALPLFEDALAQKTLPT